LLSKFQFQGYGFTVKVTAVTKTRLVCGRLKLAYVNIVHHVLAAIPRDHPESYHSFMWNHLFRHIDIDPKNAHILDGNAPDLQAECDKFEKLISEAGGIQLFIGGSFAALSLHKTVGSNKLATM